MNSKDIWNTNNKYKKKIQNKTEDTIFKGIIKLIDIYINLEDRDFHEINTLTQFKIFIINSNDNGELF